MNARTTPDAAWSQFWAQQTLAPGTGQGGGCLPRGAAIEKTQRHLWTGFADALPRKARVLDLATGDGRVLDWMYRRRDDLKLTGIDLAPTLPQAPRGTRLTGGVSMESLPFPDRSYDAVTSQFGFEYGNLAKTAREIARVLKPGGRVGLMVHRGDGPILEDNLARRNQLGWVLDDQGVLTKARVAVSLTPGGLQAAVFRAAEVARVGAARFGQKSPAWEIAEAVRRTLAMGGRAGIRFMLDTFAAIEAQARNEMARIDSLEAACRTADDRDGIGMVFAEAGLAPQSREEVREPAGRAFADFLLLGRPAD